MKITGDYTIEMLWLTIETILLKKNSEWGVTLPVFLY